MKSLMLLVGHEPHAVARRPWALVCFLCRPSGCASGRAIGCASGCVSAPLPRPFQPARDLGDLLRHWLRASLGCVLCFRSALGRPPGGLLPASVLARVRKRLARRAARGAGPAPAEVEARGGLRPRPTLCSELLQRRSACGCCQGSEVEGPVPVQRCFVIRRVARQRLRPGSCESDTRHGRHGTRTPRHGVQRAPRASAPLRPARPARCPAPRACTAPLAVPLPLTCWEWRRIEPLLPTAPSYYSTVKTRQWLQKTLIFVFQQPL